LYFLLGFCYIQNMDKVTRFTPFSKMRPMPKTLSYIDAVKDLRSDPEDRIVAVAQGGLRPQGVKLQYTAKEALDWKRKATHCELCLVPFKDFSSKNGDHHHKTGAWRGVLCRRCNFLMGWVETLDSYSGYFDRVLQYLAKQ
jgi:hypothetical protein